MLIISLALCLMMVILAANVGFLQHWAPLLWVLSLLKLQAEHIEHLVKPVKDLFAAVFSCRLVCLSILILCTLMPGRLRYTLVVIFGQSISSIIGALISGQP
jgi:CPA2 family monovalent cation:H+ antiporter-2